MIIDELVEFLEKAKALHELEKKEVDKKIKDINKLCNLENI